MISIIQLKQAELKSGKQLVQICSMDNFFLKHSINTISIRLNSSTSTKNKILTVCSCLFQKKRHNNRMFFWGVVGVIRFSVHRVHPSSHGAKWQSWTSWIVPSSPAKLTLLEMNLVEFLMSYILQTNSYSRVAPYYSKVAPIIPEFQTY